MSDSNDKKTDDESVGVWAEVGGQESVENLVDLDLDLNPSHPPEAEEEEDVTDVSDISFAPKKSKLPIFIAAGAMSVVGIGIAGFILMKVLGGSGNTQPLESSTMEMERPLDAGRPSMPGGMGGSTQVSGGPVKDLTMPVAPAAPQMEMAASSPVVAVPPAVAVAPAVPAVPVAAAAPAPVVSPAVVNAPVKDVKPVQAAPLVLAKPVPETSIPEKNIAPVSKDVKRLVLKPDSDAVRPDPVAEEKPKKKAAKAQEMTSNAQMREQHAERATEKREKRMAKRADTDTEMASAKKSRKAKGETPSMDKSTSMASDSPKSEEIIEPRQVGNFKLLAISPQAGEYPLAYLKTASDKTIVVREGESLPDGSKVNKIDYIGAKVLTSNGVIR